jgi:NADPH-dependent glutamate synthase beta subunit-like oxidoreductase/CO/xanthine dehydrogenase FAD-binding subunit
MAALRSFKHLNATSLEEASNVLCRHGMKAAAIAGGTDLLGALKDNVRPEYPELLVNIKTIPGLDYIEEDNTGLRIGALTRLHAIEKSEAVREKYRLLAMAAHSVATPHVRNMGTIAGNICQEPRCWYYRNPECTFHCLRKGGKTCNAFTGENRYHSIFGAARVSPTPCSAECPGKVDIPSYFSLIREKKIDKAAKTLLACNPMPAITGRVCPHFCETKCNRNEFDEAVSIRDIERYTGDYILDNAAAIMHPPQKENGKNVAVVGAGPAGLSAAYYLRQAGYAVTVFDKLKEAGGMLMYAIPAYRLPKDLVRRQVKALQSTGIKFRLQVDIGKDVTLEDIRKDFNAVFLATGGWGQRPLGIKDERLLISGLDWLTEVNSGLRKAPGKKVLVIGGGNAAVDVAITARRLGATNVTIACLECREEMPAIASEIEQALAEGIQLMPSWGPDQLLQGNNRIKGMQLVRCTSVFDAKGHFAPAFDNSTRTTVYADAIILAIGQRTDLSFIGSALRTERGLITVDEDTQETNTAGVYAGGDVAIGPASVIQAIAAGRRAAASIDLYLMKKRIHKNSQKVTMPKFNADCLVKMDRGKTTILPVSGRRIDIEDTAGFNLRETEDEANRCFNCGCVAVNASDIAPALIALDAKIKTTRRILTSEGFFSAGIMKTSQLEAGELVVEIQIPKPTLGSQQGFIKFAQRNSHDFPVVSVAAVLSMNADRVDAVRIVLGAIAPVPLRIKDVEDFLKGEKLNKKSAAAAGNIAVKHTLPLAKNKYKVQVAKALVEKVILRLCERVREGNISAKM